MKLTLTFMWGNADMLFVVYRAVDPSNPIKPSAFHPKPGFDLGELLTRLTAEQAAARVERARNPMDIIQMLNPAA